MLLYKLNVWEFLGLRTGRIGSIASFDDTNYEEHGLDFWMDNSPRNPQNWCSEKVRLGHLNKCIGLLRRFSLNRKVETTCVTARNCGTRDYPICKEL